MGTVSQDDELKNFIENLMGNDQKTISNLIDTSAVRPLISLALVGTESVGKSSVFNRLLGAENYNINSSYSPPEIIRQGNWLNLLRVFDTPSYDPESVETIQEISSCMIQSNLIVQVFDVDAITRRNDKRLRAFIQSFTKPYLSILNKIDISDQIKLGEIISKFESETGERPILISAKSGEGIASFLVKVVELSSNPNLKLKIIEMAKRLDFIQDRERKRVVRYNNVQKKINLHTHEAAKLGASSDPSGAILLTLHKVMINDIAEEYSELYDKHELSMPLENKITFFINSLAQEIKQLPSKTGNLFSSAHAMVWTDYVGNMAMKYFEEQLAEDKIKDELNLELQNIATSQLNK